MHVTVANDRENSSLKISSMTFTKAFGYQVESGQRSETIKVARGIISLPNVAGGSQWKNPLYVHGGMFKTELGPRSTTQ